MFDAPEKHVVIGITKSRMFPETLGDAEDILSVARGENEETVSFREYTVLVVEQDDVP